MRGVVTLLAKESLKRWMRTPGYLVVLAVALVPTALTAAWVWTHEADVAVTGLSWDREVVLEGDALNLTAQVRNLDDQRVEAFDVTLRVGYYEGDLQGNVRWRDVHNGTVRVGPLDPGQSTDATVSWTALGGTYQVEAFADFFQDEVKEIEDLNNYRVGQLQVRYPTFRPEIAPPERATEEDANATDLPAPRQVALAVREIGWEPAQLFEDDNATFRVTVANEGPDEAADARFEFQVYRLTPTGQISTRVLNDSRAATLPAGGSATLDFAWSGVERGVFAVAVFAAPPEGAEDNGTADDVLVQQLDVQRRLVWQEPEERATAKDFYRNQVLLPLHLTLLVPLVGIFYAGSVLHDDRTRGNLPYLLTRPVPRAMIPLARFAVGFVVALLPVLLGVLLTYLLLLGTPRADPGHLWWPLLFGALVVFLYVAVFTLVGVLSPRPYLVGLLYVLGFESLVLAGRRILLNGQPLVQDWVLNLSLAHWIGQAFGGWDPDGAFPWWTAEGDAAKAALVLVAIGVASLAAAAWTMTRRETIE